MNTTAAAQTAGVTIATVRHWARMGAVKATKTGGRWNIDQGSLARRVALAPRPFVLTAEHVIALGGRRWEKAGMDRVYVNDWHEYAGIEVSRYKSGNVNYLAVDGAPVANGRAHAVLGAVEKVWFDVNAGEVRVKGNPVVEIKIKGGRYETINLETRIDAGIRAAAEAL